MHHAHVHTATGKPPELVSLIYEAAADASGWQAFLDAYVEVVRGRRAALVLGTGHENGAAPFRWSIWPNQDGSLCSDRSIAEDWCRTVGEGQPEGAIRTIDLEQSTTYPEFRAPRDVRYGLAGVFLRTADAPSMIIAVRGEQDGPFGEPAFATLRPLMPHLRQAALLQREVASLRARLAAFTSYLDRSPLPFLLTDARGHVLYANAAAHQIAGWKDGIAITSGQLSVTCAGIRAAFGKAIEEAATGRGRPLCRIEVERPAHNKPPYRLLLMPVPSAAGLYQPTAAVLIIDTEARPELDAEILGELFFLTPAEARVTAKLGVGRSADEIAEEMGVSLETVRTHIRRVLSKTGTGRQGELISLVLRAAPFRRL
jgi:DNA-binding CsgD family transcriptional regulator